MADCSSAEAYERSDADPRLIAAIAAGLAAFIIITPLLLKVICPSSQNSGDALQRPPSPRLQIDAKGDLARQHASEQAQLDGAGWIDRDHNIVHIPVTRAMQLVAQRGLPGWKQSAAADPSLAR